MAAISHVFTIRRAAQILGHDEDLLWQLSDQLEPEDGKLWVYDIDGAETPAFTHDGIEALREIIKDQIDRAWLISRRVYRGAQRMLTHFVAPEQKEKRGKEDVELFLDTQRPQMQQRFGSGRVEIADFGIVEDIRSETGTGQRVPAEFGVFGRRQDEPAESPCRQHDDDQCGKESADASCVEFEEAEGAAFQPGQYKA